MSDKKISFTGWARLAYISFLVGFYGLILIIVKIFNLNIDGLMVAQVFNLEIADLILGLAIAQLLWGFPRLWVLPGLVIGSEVLKVRGALTLEKKIIPYSMIVSVEVKTIANKPRIIITYDPSQISSEEDAQFLIVPAWYAISIDELIEEIQSKLKNA